MIAHWRLGPPPVILVGVGGAIGTGIRALIIEIFPSTQGFSLSLLLINNGGAFLLGALVASLARAETKSPRTNTTRLFCGTGILGGFTSYSALATTTGTLIADGAIASGIAYGLGTVSLGILCAGLGLLAGRKITRKPSAP